MVDDEDLLLYLNEIFYDKFKSSLGGTHKSVFVELLNKRDPTPVQQKIKENSVPYSEIDSNFLAELMSKKLVKQSLNPNEYVISPYGIWVLEKNLEYLADSDIIGFIENKFFNFGISDSLTPKEKIGLLSLIAIGAFYEETPLDRKNGKFCSSKLSEVLLESNKFLVEMALIPSNLKLKVETEEEIVDSIFKRLNNLAKKTNYLYQSQEGKHWVSVYDESTDKFNSNSLSFLLWKIFEIDLDFNQQKRIDDFCQHISIGYLNYVFNNNQISAHLNIKGGFENQISDSLFDISELKEGWESPAKL